MSAEKNNQLFWLNYGQAVKDKAGANLGSTGVFFLATEAQKGPPAGDDIPDEYTYQGLFDIGNNLLATDNVFYNPSSLHGYDEALDTFLNWVDTGAQPDPKFTSALNNLLKDQIASQAYYKKQKELAFAQFKEELEMGLLPNKDFYDYVQSGKVPAFQTAQRDLDNIAMQMDQIQSRQAGPMNSTLKQDRANLAKGRNEEKDYPGYNMHGAMGNILSPAEVQRKLKAGDKIEPPVFQRIPAFNAPMYKQAVSAAMVKGSGSSFEPGNKYDVKLDFGKSTSDFDFGQTKIGGNVDVSCGGWFSFSADASNDKRTETLNTFDESSDVSLKIVYDTIQRIPITPGSWNADVSKYSLRKDAPKECRTLAKVTDLVIATYLGYEITVGSKTAQALDTKFKETTSAGGGLRIFGIPIGLGGSGSSTREHNTHNASWDNASKTLKVSPSADTGFATVIGVCAEKFTLAS